MAHRILKLALAAGTAIGIVAFAHAQGGTGQGGSSSPGASGNAPGRSDTNQPPGQGGTPPGQMMNDQKKSGTSGQGKGASDYAPGRSDNPPPGQGGTPPGQMNKQGGGNR